MGLFILVIFANIIALAFPPLLVVTVPAGVIYFTWFRARVKYLRHARQVYLDHVEMVTVAKLLK